MKNKTLIISVTVVLIIVGLIVIKSVYRVKELGHQLLTINTITDLHSNRNSPVEGFVHIGDGLYGILTSYLVSLKDLKVKSYLCDCFGHSLFVTNSIVITSPKSSLCVRLRYDVALGKYHIVGYSGSIE